MYEGNTSSSDKVHENVEEMYENILGQVKRLLAQDQNYQQQPENVADRKHTDLSHSRKTILSLPQTWTECCPPLFI